MFTKETTPVSAPSSSSQRSQSALNQSADQKTNGQGRTGDRNNSKKRRISAQEDGLTFESRFVPEGVDPYSQVKWVERDASIKNPDGTSVFSMKNIEVPAEWSQLASDIAISKYLRKSGVPKTEYETSVRQLIHRVAHTIRVEGDKQGGYFKSAQDGDHFENELTNILLTQKAAFNSPVWFNCGLHHAYGIEGSGGNFAWNFQTGTAQATQGAYERPQCSACFIQSVNDDLMSIFDLAKQEARIFKYGSGTGTNFSHIRGKQEKLSGGGLSSGLMSFLQVLDRGAGATKSGGTTRRAAKMVCLDMDHPEIVDFIEWKSKEEAKAKILMDAGYGNDFNSEAYATVSGQNSNNSVRVSDDFLRTVEADGKWCTTARTDGSTIDTYPARELWDKIARAAWQCADPGLQFDTTINKWHTCSNTDKIHASNPCSEFMFLDDTACNLASINLMKYLKSDGSFDVDGFKHTVRILIAAQDILVDFSSYPTKPIAINSHDYRPLGLGYANLGTLLMMLGLPYDSEEGRAWAGTITALMHGEAFRTSSEIAAAKGPFTGFTKNREPMLKVMGLHKNAVKAINSKMVPHDMYAAAEQAWDDAEAMGHASGYRNSQVTVLAPTGTIGFLMDCDTTGIEPEFALVKIKKLAGGGHIKIVNQSVPSALHRLGYSNESIDEIVRYAVGTASFEKCPGINRTSLMAKGFTPADIDRLEKLLPLHFGVSSIFTGKILGADLMARLKITDAQAKGENGVLGALGFTADQIQAASYYLCGRLTVEGAPHLKDEHLPIFDCANKCGTGSRYLAPRAHIHMMAAAQPFLSGAISKTVNVPYETTVEEIRDLYMESWKLGLKAVAVYRDGSKHSQPLNSGTKTGTASTGDKVYSQKDMDEAIKQAMQLAPSRRHHLPRKRHGFTVEAKVAGHKLYLRTGEYQDGRLGEIFIDMHKEGATFRSLLNCFAISVSTGLQYGVPLDEYVEKFTFTRFEPQGMVDHPNIKQATSIVDFVFRVLGMEYLGKTNFVHVKPVDEHKPALEPQPELPLEKAIAHPVAADSSAALDASGDGVSAYLSKMMGDAPMCNECGHTTVRNGTCYRCLNCGNSMGCS